MRFIRIAIANLLLIITLFAFITPPALAQLNQPAQVIGIPFMSTDNVAYAMPASFGGFLSAEFNSTALTQNYFGDLAISFKPLTFSAIPDERVLDLPHIHQDIDASLSYQDTYFFTDTFG
ncbi:MAG: hypothetical protein ACM3NG_00380 [Candidatus Doudnabacteria bacterium]